jgi:hypothetical protein
MIAMQIREEQKNIKESIAGHLILENEDLIANPEEI